MGVSFSTIHLLLATLAGLYIGLNLSTLHVHEPSPSSPLSKSRSPENGETTTDNDTTRRLEDEVKQWKDQVKKLETDYAVSLNKVHTLEESCKHDDTKPEDAERISMSSSSSSSKSSSSSSLPFTNPHPICQHALSTPIPTATSVWYDNLLKILSATRVPNDPKFQFHDFTTQLLQIISPRLIRSIKTTTTDWRPVERALSVAWERYQYINLPYDQRQKIQNPPRPLKILIMGGSLLVGTNCRKLMTELGLGLRLPKRDCTWSNRIGQFLNAFFGGSQRESLVQVTKVAMGGTNTATGSVIWQYDLIPEEARNPDIVLNAYSTNDMHILTILEAESSNTTLRDRTFDILQTFTRQVLSTTSCPDSDSSSTSGGSSGESTEPIPPLLMHIDDYLGNEQRGIWDTTTMSQGVQVLANYYGFVSMSYADVVRDFVYGDTYETWFSSEWWKVPESTSRAKRRIRNPEPTELAFEREIHPGMGMHISSTWVVAFNLLHLATTFCSLPTPEKPSNLAEYEPGLWGLPSLHNNVPQAKNKPRSQVPVGILPPVLTKELLLEDITGLWQKEVQEQKLWQEQHHSTVCQTSSDGNSKQVVKCPFSWVSDLSLQQNNKTWISEYFEKQSTTWVGWELSDDGGKIGFTPTSSTTTTATTNERRMVLNFQFPHQMIRSITLFFMKSYGPKWANSQLNVRVMVPVGSSSSGGGDGDSTILHERLLSGIHAKNTSEMYTEEMILEDPIQPDSLLQVQATLVGGEMFKIMGLAVCS